MAKTRAETVAQSFKLRQDICPVCILMRRGSELHLLYESRQFRGVKTRDLECRICKTQFHITIKGGILRDLFIGNGKIVGLEEHAMANLFEERVNEISTTKFDIVNVADNLLLDKNSQSLI